MVEPDRAELVDDHGGARERRVAQQAREQRRLAAAEEAGEHRNRDWRHRQGASVSRPRNGCAPITRRPAGASGASASRNRRSRPGRPAWRPSSTVAPEAGSRTVTTQPAAGWWHTRIVAPVEGAMRNPFASSGSGPTAPSAPQSFSAPEKTRAVRARHERSWSTKES